MGANLERENKQIAMWRSIGFTLLVPAIISFMLLATYFWKFLRAPTAKGRLPESYQDSALVRLLWDYSPPAGIDKLFSPAGLYVLALLVVTLSPLFVFTYVKRRNNDLKLLRRQVRDERLKDEMGREE